MGRRGPAPMPTPLKILRGETRPSRLNHNEPRPAANLPLVPSDLPDVVQAVWRRVLKEFGHTLVIRAADADVLRLYCDAVVRYDESSRLLSQSGPLIRGARAGELIKNPLHQIVRDNATLVRALAGDLGLSPASRVGLTNGSGKSAEGTPLEALLARRAT